MKNKTIFKLIALRCELKMNQFEFAKHIGINRSTLNRYENNKCELSDVRLMKIALACGKDTEYFFDD